MYRVEPMSEEYAHRISLWCYPNEYRVYSFSRDEDTLAELMGGAYYACVDGESGLIGYFCFGVSAQIPTVENDVYDETALDIGLGLRPDLCGQGLGFSFVRSGMNYAKENLQVNDLRLSVACFNHRATHLYRKLGFEGIAQVTHEKSGKSFLIMGCRG